MTNLTVLRFLDELAKKEKITSQDKDAILNTFIEANLGFPVVTMKDLEDALETVLDEQRCDLGLWRSRSEAENKDITRTFLAIDRYCQNLKRPVMVQQIHAVLMNFVAKKQ